MYYIGIDLGGTNIAVGIVSEDAKVLFSDSTPTLAPRSYKEVVADMAMVSNKLLKENNISIDEIAGIGLGCPGSVDSKNGMVYNSNNLGWDNVDIVSELKSHFPNTHIAIENDANAAAYGEFRATGNGAENFIAITLGTGVGGGIIINNKIYRGLNGSAGELGHIFIVEDGEYCTCGCNGCWEAYASVTALIRQTKEAIAAHPESLMAQDENINGMTSFKAAKAGDKAAQEVVDTYIRHVACGITSLINIFVPDVLVIGGGISKEGDYLLNPIKEYVKKNVFCKVGAQTEIKIATLMNDAGIVGAALASAE